MTLMTTNHHRRKAMRTIDSMLELTGWLLFAGNVTLVAWTISRSRDDTTPLGQTRRLMLGYFIGVPVVCMLLYTAAAGVGDLLDGVTSPAVQLGVLTLVGVAWRLNEPVACCVRRFEMPGWGAGVAAALASIAMAFVCSATATCSFYLTAGESLESIGYMLAIGGYWFTVACVPPAVVVGAAFGHHLQLSVNSPGISSAENP